MIRILIVDDQAIIRDGLRVILADTPTITIVDTAHDGVDALERVALLQPDLVLMDLKMPRMNGVQATAALQERFPNIPVVILTTYDDDEWVIDAIRAGARGYLLKETSRDGIIAAIEGTIAGRTHLDPAVADKVFHYIQHGAPPNKALFDLLSERERDVLRLLASGLSNAAIADRLALAEGTVRNHVSNILAKLEVDDRAQATALAWRTGLVRGIV